MTRLAALLLLLLACDSGLLQWSDAENWSGRSTVTRCEFLPAGMCFTLTHSIDGFSSLSRSVPDLSVGSSCIARVNMDTGSISVDISRFEECRVTPISTLLAPDGVSYIGYLTFSSGESHLGTTSIEVRTTWLVNALWFDDTIRRGTILQVRGIIDVVTTLSPVH